MRLNLKVAVGAVVLLAAWGARAQGLSDFLAAAAQRNPDARLAAEAANKARADAGKAWGGLLPSLSASGAYTYNEYPAVISAGPFSSSDVVIVPRDQLTASFRAELPLLDPGRWLTAAAAAASVDAAEARQAAGTDAVRRQVVSAYFSVAGARAVVDSAQRSLALAKAQLEQTGSRRAAGVANELELERAKAEVERNQQVLADAEALEATTSRALASLSGLEPRALPPLPDDDLHAEAPVETLEARAAELPQVEAADAEARAAGRSSTAAALALVPSVSAQFTQQLTNATGFQGATHLFNAGLVLNWRLDVPTVQGLRSQASLEATAAIDAEKARTQARDQIFDDWQQVRVAIIKVRSTKAQVAAARRAQALAHERYDAGVATQLDTIQADRDLLVAEVSEIQARGALASARLALRLSSGQPLEVTP